MESLLKGIQSLLVSVKISSFAANMLSAVFSGLFGWVIDAIFVLITVVSAKMRAKCVAIISLVVTGILFIFLLITRGLFNEHSGITLKGELDTSRTHKYYGQVEELDSQQVYPNGNGRLFDKLNGDMTVLVYHGGFYEGLRHGKGTFYEFDDNGNSVKTEGQWHEDYLYGHVVKKTSINGEEHVTFSGEYYRGLPNGSGTETKYDQSGELIGEYKGGFADGYWHGFGIETDYLLGKPYRRYSGNYSCGNKNGHGALEYYDGPMKKVYVGSFVDNYREGNGITYLISAEGDRKVVECGCYSKDVLIYNDDTLRENDLYNCPSRVFDFAHR